MKNLEIDDNYVQGLAEKARTAFTDLGAAAEKGLGLSDDKVNASYKAIMGVIAAATAIVGPLIEILIIMLPEIIKLIQSIIGEATKNDNLRKKFEGEIFPAITRKLRAELPAQLDAQITEMIEAARARYQEQIDESKARISDAIEEKQAGKAAQEQERAILEEIRDNVKALSGEIAAAYGR